MGTTFASLNSELVSSAVALDIESPQQPKAPLPTPAGTPAVRGGRPMSESTLSLNANDIATAFALAHEQLRTTPLTQPRHGCTAISPVAFALPQAQGRPSAVDNDKESPVVKTTRQVSSVLAAVAELEAAQGVTGKRAAGKLTRPFSAGMTKPQTPGSANTTPMHKFSTRFIQSPAVTQVPTAQAQGLAAPGLSNVANPLFSPVASSLDPMLTPFYTPASMSSIRTGVETPDSRVADSRANPLTEGTPTGLATPASGLVSGDWRSVTDRLQALRAQLQSAQKKLKATSEDKQKRSALLGGTPLADITSRHQQLTPTALPSSARQHSSRAGPTPSALVTPAVAAQADVEEQCLSAGRWLRGLAEECCENVFTPARLQPDDIDDASQAAEDQAVALLGDAFAHGQSGLAHIRTRELVSYPIVPTSPSSWDESSVTSSPAMSVHSPLAHSVPARVSPIDRLLARCKRVL